MTQQYLFAGNKFFLTCFKDRYIQVKYSYYRCNWTNTQQCLLWKIATILPVAKQPVLKAMIEAGIKTLPTFKKISLEDKQGITQKQLQ